MEQWQRGWTILGDILANLTDSDLSREVTIRTVPHTVALAIARQIDHYAYHVGQIAMLSRMQVGDAGWKWFTIAPGGSEAFNRKLGQNP